MIRLRNLKAAWRLLNSRKHFLVSSVSEVTDADLCENALLAAAMTSHEKGYLSTARYDMVESILYDPSVIMLSKGVSGTCYTAYDCQSEEDFNDLKECEIE